MTAPRVHHATLPDHGIDVLVTIWPDVTTIATRAIGGDGWTTWSPPVALTEVHEQHMPEAMHEGVRHG